MPLPRWLARVNRRLLNPREIARGERPVLTHVGRTSGATYRTPLDARPVDGGFVVDLRYGSRSDWVRNVLAAGSAQLEVDGRRHHLVRPRLVGPSGTEQLRLDTARTESPTGMRP